VGRLDNKVAVITGGASGIGEGTVRLFAQEGARIVIADVQDDKGKRLEDELDERAVYVHTDVTQEDQIKGAIDAAVRKFGRLDCLYNNAGIPGPNEGIASIAADIFDSTVDVLFRAAFLGMKHAAPVMRAQGSGSIISTASVAGLDTGAAGHIYSACKAAVIHLTRSVAKELGEQGIRVNCICPGGIATPIFGKAMGLSSDLADQTVDMMKMLLPQAQPIPRAGLPEDIAKAALWLASDDSSFVNGHALVVDGGLIHGPKWSQFEQMGQAMAAFVISQAGQGD
jgi:NAD(P)-dependent dehydrogenase (short-subunit alcohol dehydrogenase family)